MDLRPCFQYDDRIDGAPVVFGKEGNCPLLGRHTLLAPGLGLDPIRCQLVPLPMTLAQNSLVI